MVLFRDTFPDAISGVFLTYTGFETDLIFNHGVDLPDFAAYPLLETESGCRRLQKYMKDLVAIGQEMGLGVILESSTWVASRDRGAAIGYSPARLRALNKKAIAVMDEVRAHECHTPVLLSANIGPRDDAYAPKTMMRESEAEHYHAEQIATLAGTSADFVSAYTLSYPEEAIGIARAAEKAGLPVVVSFTVETDGCLPTGLPLSEAISEVDDRTNGEIAYYMINCAHPDHLEASMIQSPSLQRIRGIVANASRCSHAELEQARELDEGDPQELALQLRRIHQRFPQIQVLGGCCGTNMRHMREIAMQLGKRPA